MLLFNIFFGIIWRQWLPEVWNPWTSPNAGFPPLLMLCQAFTEALFSCCLFEGLSAQIFVLSKWNASSVGLGSVIDSTVAEYSTSLLDCFCSMFCIIVHLYCEAPWNQHCCIWLNRSRKYIPKLFTPLLSFVAPINTSDPVPLETITLPPPCFTEDVVFQFFSKCWSSRNSDRGWS